VHLLEDRLVPSTTAVTIHAPIHHVLPTKAQMAAMVRPHGVETTTQLIAKGVEAPAMATSNSSTVVPQALTSGGGFNGIGLQFLIDQTGGGPIPPDTMGCVGPNQFVQMTNGAFAVFTKTGRFLGGESLDLFWADLFPVNGTSDPHIVYDSHSGRWFASSIDINDGISSNHLFIAVSRTNDPLGAWSLYKVNAATQFEFADYDTLGVDDNGVYFGMNMFSTDQSFSNAAIFATRKAPLLSGASSIVVTKFDGITDMEFSPQPAYNFDTVAATGQEWIVSSSTTVFANLEFRTITWSGITPRLSPTGTIASPKYGDVLSAPSFGATLPLETDDDRLLMSIVRGKVLYTARTVGLGDRDAAEYLEVDTTHSTLVQSGRAEDSPKSNSNPNPRYYYYPSVMVNSQGYMVMGFSGARATEFISAYATARLHTDPAGTLQPVTLLKAGQGAYTIDFGSGRNRWGDYSYTSLDPTDGKTIWTIQEYAAPQGAVVNNSSSRWGVWINSFKAPATAGTSVDLSAVNTSAVGQGPAIPTAGGAAAIAASSPGANLTGASAGLIAAASGSAIPGSASVDHFFASATSAHAGALAARSKSPSGDPLDNWIENVF
jgi:hypothetical protein